MDLATATLFIWTIGTANKGMAKIITDNITVIKGFPSMSDCLLFAKALVKDERWMTYAPIRGAMQKNGRPHYDEGLRMEMRVKCIPPLRTPPP